MTAVVDLGCHDHGQWNSLGVLAELFHPEVIYGFDPSPDLDTSITEVAGTPVVLERKAAWIEDGELPFTEGVGTISAEGSLRVPCFNFAEWLDEHGPCAVKMDVEGAEYALLAHLIHTGVQSKMSYLFVEWHTWVNEDYVSALDCPVVRWWL